MIRGRRTYTITFTAADALLVIASVALVLAWLSVGGV